MDYSGLVIHLILLGLCLLFSAFFSASETALLSLPRSKVFKLARASAAGGLVRRAVNQPEKLLGAILLGNNLFNVAGSVVGASLGLALWGSGSLPFVSAGLIVLFLILAEITPKTLAAFKPDRVSLLVIRPLRLFVIASNPVVQALTWITRGLLRVTGQPTQSSRRFTREDLLTLVMSGQREGYLDVQEQEMLHNILELDRITLRQVMVPLKDIRGLEASRKAGQALELTAGWSYSRYPVFVDQPERVIGYVHLRDLLTAPAETSLESLVQRPVFVPDSRSVRKQLLDFRRQQIHLAFVVNEFGRLLGLVTLEDVLEEIVGEIHDEYDVDGAGVLPLTGGGFLIDGRLTVREINRFAGLNLPLGPYDTLSGLVQAVAQKIPEPGEVVIVGQWELEVESMAGKAVDKVTLRPRPAQGKEPEGSA